MGWAEALAADRQRRRLLLAAAAIELFPPTRGTDAPAPLAVDLARSGYVLGAESPAPPPGEPALPPPVTASVAGAPPDQSAWRDPARRADLFARVEPLARTWFAAGIRLLTAAEITDERTAVSPLGDATPALVWAHFPAGEASAQEVLAAVARWAPVHSRKPREMHGGVPWVAATAPVLAAWLATQPPGAPPPVFVTARHARWERLIRAAVDSLGGRCLDVLAEPLPALRNPSAQPAEAPDGFVPALMTLTACWPAKTSAAAKPTAEATLRRDELILAVATRVLGIQLDAAGNWHRRLALALRQPGGRERVAVVQIIDATPKAAGAKAAAELIAAGARPLPVTLPVDLSPPSPSAPLSVPLHAPAGRASIAPLPTFVGNHDWPYLTHWTRRPSGPWPDETSAAWLTRLLPHRRENGWTPPECREVPTALDALIRILTQRRLVGGAQFLRVGPAVCFTQWPPARLFAQPAAARRHRGLHRPLYEPFGLALRQEYLLEAGVAPVIYGDEAVFHSLSPEDRFRFQYDAPDSAPWAREGEWRIPGDFDFANADPVDFFVLVPDESAAVQLLAAIHDPTLCIKIMPTAE